MAQIKVISAVTTNGRDPLIRNGQQVFKTTILEETARPILEKMNRFKPEHLRFKFESLTTETVEAKKSKKNDTE